LIVFLTVTTLSFGPDSSGAVPSSATVGNVFGTSTSGSVPPKISSVTVVPTVVGNSSHFPAVKPPVSPVTNLWISSIFARSSGYFGSASGLASSTGPNKAPIAFSTPIPISL